VTAVRARLSGVVEVEVVAMAGLPLAGPAGASARAALEAALDAGATVVGGAPWLDPEPEAALDVLLGVAAARGLPVDLHLDETTGPRVDTLTPLLRAVRGGFGQPVTASHVVSLGSLVPARQEAVAAELVEAGVAVVTLPRTNLWLQTRHLRDAAPRGLTAVRALLDAGVTLAAGGDNLRDTFNPHGPADPLDVARLLATVVEVSADEALAAVTTQAGRVLRPGPPRSPVVAAGDRADLVVVDGTSLEDALARTPAGRLTLHAGRVVAAREVSENDVVGPGWRLPVG
jgi:cytosine deaminase